MEMIFFPKEIVTVLKLIKNRNFVSNKALKNITCIVNINKGSSMGRQLGKSINKKCSKTKNFGEHVKKNVDVFQNIIILIYEFTL